MTSWPWTLGLIGIETAFGIFAYLIGAWVGRAHPCEACRRREALPPTIPAVQKRTERERDTPVVFVTERHVHQGARR